jgi:NDP-sugar pyrophosphorylase family protein
MVEIAGKPILSHIMMHYGHYRFRNFVALESREGCTPAVDSLAGSEGSSLTDYNTSQKITGSMENS